MDLSDIIQYNTASVLLIMSVKEKWLSQVTHETAGFVSSKIHGTLRLEKAASVDELKSHADAWDKLVEQSPSRIPAASYAWVSSCLEHLLKPEEHWVCLFAYDGVELVGVVPVVSNGGRDLKSSAHLSIASNPHTFSVDFLTLQGREHEVIPFLLSSLHTCCPAWTELRCPRISELSATRAVLENSSHDHLWAEKMRIRGNYIHSVGPFNDYLGRLDKNFARNLQRVSRKIEDLDGFELLFLTGADAKPELIREFAAVEASGWKGREGSAILKSERLMRFYTSLAQRLAVRGWLEWHILRAEDRSVACHMAVRMGSKVLLWKIAFDEDFQSYAPGNVLMMSTFRRAFLDPGIDEVDCLTDSKWNVNWKMEHRTYHYFAIWPRKPLAILGGYLPAKARLMARDIPGARSLWKRLGTVRKRISDKKS